MTTEDENRLRANGWIETETEWLTPDGKVSMYRKPNHPDFKKPMSFGEKIFCVFCFLVAMGLLFVAVAFNPFFLLMAACFFSNGSAFHVIFSPIDLD